MASAAKAFAKALSFKALPRQQHEQLQFNLGQLYIVAGQHEEGIKTLQDYIANACGTVAGRSAHLSRECADREEALSRKRCRRSTWRCRRPRSRRRLWLQMKLAIELRAEGLQRLRGCAGAADRHGAGQARLLEAAVEHVLRDEAGHGGGGGARAGGAPGIHRRSRTRCKNLYSVYMMLDLPFKAGHADAGSDRQESRSER